MLLTRDTIACQVLAEWLEDQTEWLLLVQLTLQKGGFRQGNPMVLKGDSDCCCCAHKDTALPDGETPWPWRTNGIQNMRFPRPERPFWNLLQKLAIRFWLLARCELLHCCRCAYCCVCLCLLLPTDTCCCLLLPAAACCLLLPAAPCCCAHKDTTLPDGETPWPWRTNGVQNRRFPGPERPFWNLLEKACYTFLDFSMLATGSCCCCCAHKDTALPDGETPWPWRTNGVQNRCFPGPEHPFWNLLEKACYTFLNAGYWELLLLLLTLQKGGFRQGNPMLLKGDSDCCCCCCAHKNTAQAFPGAGTSLLKSPTKTCYIRFWLLARCELLHCCRCAYWCVCLCLLLPTDACCCLLLPAAACGCLLPAAACCSLLLCPQRHDPPGRGNTMALKDERSPK